MVDESISFVLAETMAGKRDNQVRTYHIWMEVRVGYICVYHVANT